MRALAQQAMSAFGTIFTVIHSFSFNNRELPACACPHADRETMNGER